MKFLIFLMISMFFSPACSTVIKGAPDSPVNVTDELASTAFAFEKAAIDEYLSATGSDKQILRNDIVHARIRAYDIKYSEFEADLFSFGIGTGVGTDWATLAISGLTAVTGGASTKAALGAANTAIIGAKGALDKRLLLEKTTPAVMAEMVNQRTRVLLDLKQGLSQDVSDYGLFQAFADLERYRRAGTLSGGLVCIVISAGQETKTNEDKISNIVSGTYLKDEASAKLIRFWKPGGASINSSNENAIKTWMKNNNLTVGAGAITNFIYTAEFSDLRVKAVSDLKL